MQQRSVSAHFTAQEASGDRLVVAEDAPVEVDEASWAAARARRVETARRLSFMVCVDAMRCDAMR
jgi:hypothetical protein